mmetsp:Transcript_30570/g.93562  ORF Transcript_30570/g.93562 Transcript_30570/m.93562 type:complete len:335 (-) Transcript_30570:44-1048(-)
MSFSLLLSVGVRPEFERQLASARAQRASLSSSACESSLSAAGLCRETIVQYDTHSYPLAATFSRALCAPCELERLHGVMGDQFSPARESHATVIATKQRLLGPLARKEEVEELFGMYDELVEQVVLPHIAGKLFEVGVECEAALFATVPTVRVQQPSELATIRPHCDGMYGMPPGSVNVWIPLTTRISPTATLHIESEPGAEDFHPLLPAYGEMALFDGRRCIHYTLPNRSGRTRVSLDFRVVPLLPTSPLRQRRNKAAPTDDERLLTSGYFSLAQRIGSGGVAEGRAPSAFRKVASGRVSRLHGFPHDKKPTSDPLDYWLDLLYASVDGWGNR